MTEPRLTEKGSVWWTRLLLSIAMALVLPGRIPAQDDTGPAADPAVRSAVERAQDRIAKGDWTGALLVLRPEIQAGEKDPAFQSALSRAYSEIGEDAPKGSAAQERNYQLALERAQKEVALASNSAQAHLDVSITTGKMASVSGAGTKLKLAPIVAAEARKTIELDRDNWRAYHVLGVWNREIATLGGFKKFGASLMGGLPKASLADAITNLETARRLAPGSVRNRLELARTYEKAHRPADARAEYLQAISLPASEPRDRELQREAKAELADLR